MALLTLHWTLRCHYVLGLADPLLKSTHPFSSHFPSHLLTLLFFHNNRRRMASLTQHWTPLCQTTCLAPPTQL